ncbi:hypothetical protein BKG59_05425 [Mycobacteroides chelonae]|nr:hypothetical protein BKG59_05425 [Mycobacteroides chelonae]
MSLRHRMPHYMHNFRSIGQVNNGDIRLSEMFSDALHRLFVIKSDCAYTICTLRIVVIVHVISHD